MPISIQGNWKITVIEKQPTALPQRYIITNATSGNGVYDGYVGQVPTNVSGNFWMIKIQANESYDLDGQWIESSIRTTQQRQEGNFLVFEIESEDLVQDNSWNDLVLRLTQEIPVIVPPPPVIPPTVTPPPVVPPVIIPPTVIPPPPIELGVGRTFTKFDFNDILPTQKNRVTYGIWGATNGNLLTYYTCSNDSGSFKKSVFQLPCNDCSSERMFDIAYGNYNGSGSRDIGGYDRFTPSNAIYQQYKSLCLNDTEKFNLNGRDVNHFYVINVARNKMGDKLDEGLIEINLHHLSGSQWGINQTHTGSNVRLGTSGNILRLIENESYLVSGSLEDGIYNLTNPHYYGLVYPKIGAMIIDADKLDMSASFLTVTGSDVNGDNSMKLFTSLSGSALFTDASGDYLGLKCRKYKYEYSTKYIVRVKNQEYNFSNNPTFWSGSEGVIIPDFANRNPQTFITTVGLYNNNYELMAIGKLNYPKVKNYTTEALVEVNLKYT